MSAPAPKRAPRPPPSPPRRKRIPAYRVEVATAETPDPAAARAILAWLAARARPR